MQNEFLVHLTLTQAEHNQLKHAMAKMIHTNHLQATVEREEAQYSSKILGDKPTAKEWYKFSQKSINRANRLGKLQAKIKYPEAQHTYSIDC